MVFLRLKLYKRKESRHNVRSTGFYADIDRLNQLSFWSWKESGQFLTGCARDRPKFMWYKFWFPPEYVIVIWKSLWILLNLRFDAILLIVVTQNFGVTIFWSKADYLVLWYWWCGNGGVVMVLWWMRLEDWRRRHGCWWVLQATSQPS